MLKFFRTIRKKLIEENNARKYLLYAIGEILLVVVGILIALQVNNWNEERLKRDKEYDYLIEIRENLVADTLQVNRVLAFNTAKRDTVNKVIQTLLSDADPIETTWFISSNMAVLVEFEIFYPNRVAFDNMVNAESISLVRDPGLRQALSMHYSNNDIYQGTQERVRQLTRNFTDRIIPFLSHKEMVDSLFTADSHYPSAMKSGIKQDPVVLGDLRVMNSIMEAQNKLLLTLNRNKLGLIDQIDIYLNDLRQ